MRKKSFVLIFVMFVAIFCGFYFCDVNNFNQVNALEISTENDQEDIYETIKINKNISKDDLLKKINEDKQEKEIETNVVTTASVEESSEELSYDEVVEICETNDYVVMTTSYGYEIYYKFQLKTLIVNDDLENTYGATEVKECGDYLILEYDTEEETKNAYNALLEQNIDVFADMIVTLSAIDNFTSGDFNSWGADAMDIDTYRSYYSTNGSSKEAVVAVIDSGINTSHELFDGRLLTSGGKIVGYCDDDITTTYTYSGYSFEDDNTHGYDSNGNLVASYAGHGTHVSGTICELTPTNVKILPMKVFNYYGSCSFEDIYEALQAIIDTYSKTYNVVAVNMSLGGSFTQAKAAEINDYISSFFNNLRAKNILPVVAAGNKATDTSYTAPGGCGDSAIVVSALKKSGTSYVFDSSYSNYGSSIDISAPGTAIKSASIGTSATTKNTNRYITISGTSMATPHVAAAVALLCLDGNYYTTGTASYTASAIEKRLFDCAINMGDAEKYGNGMLNLKYFNGNISYSASNTTVTYDGNYHNISVSVSGVTGYTILYGFSSTDCTISNISTNAKFKNYTNGAMYVYFKITATNYLDTIGRATLTINKANVTISTQDQTSIYGTFSLDQTKYSLTSGTIYGSDNLGITLSTTASATMPVGNYDISATATNTNYNLTVNKGKYIITKRPISITLNSQSSVYGETIKLDTTAYTITSANGLVNSDNLELELSTTATSSSPVGKYTITFVSANSNYSVTATEGTLEITAREIAVSSTQYGYYGDEVKLDTTDYSVTGVISGDNLDLEMTTEATEKSSVGKYAITITSKNANYSISTEDCYYQIYRRPISIIPNAQTSVYGEEVNLSQSAYTIENLVNDDSIVVSLTSTATSESSVGDYVISASYQTSAVTNNYTITTKTGTLTIVPRTITITALDQTSEYGYNVTLNQEKWKISSGSLVNGDTLTITISTAINSTKTVGDYKSAIIVSVSGEDISKYSISTESGTLTISPRSITIQISDQETVYGREISLQEKYDVTEGGIVNGDELNIELKTEATSSSEVGEYDITLTYNNENYNVTHIKGTLYIKGREVIITILPQESVYGETVVLDQTKYSSVEDVSDLGIALITYANSSSSVGEYQITATTTNSNVMLSYTAGVLTITPRDISITISDQTCTYGSIVLDQTKYVLGEPVSSDVVPIELTTDETNSSPVGTDYSISAKTTNKNYNLVGVAGNLTITPMEITITLEDQTCIYGEINLNQTKYSLSAEAINGDNLNIEIKTDENNTSNVGNNYEIYFEYDNENYKLTGENAVLTIEARPIEITINQTCEYGEDFIFNEETFEVVSSNKIVNDDDIKLELVSSLEENLTPESYEIAVVSKNDNYIVTISSALVEITPKSIIITIGNNTSVYGNEINLENTPYEIDEDLIGDDELKIKFETVATEKSSVKTYPITATCEGADAGNYSIEYVNGTLTITQRKITLKVIDQQGMYGEKVKPQALYTTTSEYGIVNDDNLNLEATTEADETSAVGQYVLTLTYDNDNYDVTIIDGWFVITEGDLFITILPQTFTYGDEISLDQTAFEPSIDLDKSILGITLKTTATNLDKVGDEYQITLEYTNTNYKIVWNPGKLTISKRPCSITLENQTSEYGNINLNQTKFTLTNVKDGDDLQIELSTDATNKSQAKKYYNIGFVCKNTNYEVTPTNTATLYVEPREVTIKTNQSAIYGDNIELNNSNYSVVSGEVVANENLQISFSTDAKKYSKVGIYSVNFISDNVNYAITLSDESSFEILKREITINFEQNKYYGDEINLKSTGYVIVSGSVVNNDNLNLVLSTDATKSSDVGEYSIYLDSCNSNYKVTLNSGKLNVCKRIIFIEAIKTGEYGNYFALNNSYDIVEGSLAFESDNLNVRFETNATTNSPVGNDYELTMTYDNNNYDVELRSTSHFEVTPRKISVQIGNQTSEYGDAVVLNQNNYEIVSGEIIIGDELNISLNSNVNQLTHAGSYGITGSWNNSNYQINFNNGIYTVAKRKVTIKLKNQNIARGITFELDQNAYEITEGSVIDGDELNLEIYSKAKMFSMMGNYKLMAKYDNDNYDVTVINGKLFLNISFIDVAVIVLIGGIIAFVVVKVVKHRKAKRDNQKLFDKWIKW